MWGQMWGRLFLNPFFLIKINELQNKFGGKRGIRTLVTGRPVNRISSPAHSTTLPSFRKCSGWLLRLWSGGAFKICQKAAIVARASVVATPTHCRHAGFSGRFAKGISPATQSPSLVPHAHGLPCMVCVRRARDDWHCVAHAIRADGVMHIACLRHMVRVAALVTYRSTCAAYICGDMHRHGATRVSQPVQQRPHD